MSTKHVMAALALARSEFSRASKDGRNPHLKNRYATLASIVDACEEALGRHGLTFAQPVVITKAGPVLRTILHHVESGEQIKSDIPLLSDLSTKVNPMQALGSACSYARRYGLETLLGIMRDEDEDDGEGAYPRRDRHYGQQGGQHQQGGQRPQGQPQRQQAPQGRHQAARPTQQAPRQQADAPETPQRRPFAVWAAKAAERLGIEKPSLMDRLHDAAVRANRMPAVEPDVRAEALARRYYDQARGQEWAEWMRAECLRIKADLEAGRRGDAYEPDPDADPEDAPWDPPADEPAPAPAKPAPAVPTGPRAEMTRREWDAWVKGTAGSMAITEWQLVRALHRSGVQAGRWPEKPDTNGDVMRVVSAAWLGSGRAWVEHEAEAYRAELARRAAEAPAVAGKVGGR